MKKIQIGDVVRPRKLLTTDATPLALPDARRLIHLQFRRFAGCPFCSVHMAQLQRRHADIAAAGIREVVVFRATAAALQKHHAALPFALIADPEDALYAEFGVGCGLRAVLNPRVLLMALPAIIRQLPRLPGLPARGKGVLGLPADFLIAADGRVLALKYGRHADDQWSVDELLAKASVYAAGGLAV